MSPEPTESLSWSDGQGAHPVGRSVGPEELEMERRKGWVAYHVTRASHSCKCQPLVFHKMASGLPCGTKKHVHLKAQSSELSGACFCKQPRPESSFVGCREHSFPLHDDISQQWLGKMQAGPADEAKPNLLPAASALDDSFRSARTFDLFAKGDPRSAACCSIQMSWLPCT